MNIGTTTQFPLKIYKKLLPSDESSDTSEMELEANDLLKASESLKVRLLSIDRPSRSQYRLVEGDDDDDGGSERSDVFRT